MNILVSHMQLVHCKVEDKESQFACEITFVYGMNTQQERQELWRILKQINSSITEPWMVIGDFNAILSVHDRVNGLPVKQSEMEDFQNCIQEIGLGQLSKKVCTYSWCNKRGEKERIYSLIDWAFGNDLWFMKYGKLEAYYHISECSDHSPIIIRTEVAKQKLPRPFILVNVLLSQESFKEAVHKVWEQQVQGHTMYSIWRKLKFIEIETPQMNKEMSMLERKISVLEEELKQVQLDLSADLFNEQLITTEKEILMQLDKWATIHEQVIRQKSRATWLAYGDSNTRFFHAALKARQARNRISSICTEDGV
ncbi:PREDICTED: uncharacterized protein LOC109227596 [Nicotiana attenuata]|uniref:uncharacterized protein LOC109227596 n=1 Tax=Nicotiana attenuata TaxID=49451 RepID=UPI000904AA55|nr:PREDICTED: uncharacterized protein LOC109227596 [Nicotiana attenuata]